MGGTTSGALPPDVAVVGFGRTVHVFGSKQRPKKLTIYGSDFRPALTSCYPAAGFHLAAHFAAQKISTCRLLV